MRGWIAGGLAAIALSVALALPVLARAGASAAPPSQSSWIETWVLLRWGHGALDWLSPDNQEPTRGRTHEQRH